MGNLLELLYPLSALAVGTLLYLRRPALYLGFTWWVWFLTPEVRRLVDYQYGWNPQSPVMLAPYLVAGLTLFTLLHHLPKLLIPRFFPFGLVLLGLFYGYGVGAFRAGTLAATFDLLNWLIPVVVAFYLVVHWRGYPHYRRAILRVFTWGVIVMGLYGLLQFFDPPAWDRYWMLNAPLSSIGVPEPFKVRVFSTLNSPGSFAVVMMAGLLLLSRGGLLRWPAAGVGYVSFLLSLVRAAWGGWVVGLLFLTTYRGRFRPRPLAVVAVTGVIAMSLLSFGPIAETVNTRLQTVTDLQQDQSFAARLGFYSGIAPQALLNPVGEGLGSTGTATKLGSTGGELGAFGDFDSGIMNIPFVLGWPGSLLYVSGLVWLLSHALRGGTRSSDLFAMASQGIVVAVLVQLIFGNSLTGVGGMVFWSFLGLSWAARSYHSQSAKEGARQGAAGRPLQRSVPTGQIAWR